MAETTSDKLAAWRIEGELLMALARAESEATASAAEAARVANVGAEEHAKALMLSARRASRRRHLPPGETVGPSRALGCGLAPGEGESPRRRMGDSL